MSDYVWRPRESTYRKGYLIRTWELMDEYYDWEEDPMCDCTPARKYRKSTGEWEACVYRTYAYTKETFTNVYTDFVGVCDEAWAKAGHLCKDVFDKLMAKLTSEDIPLKDVKSLFETAVLESEAIRLMP